MSESKRRQQEPVSHGRVSVRRQLPRERTNGKCASTDFCGTTTGAARNGFAKANSIASIDALLDQISTGVAIIRFNSFKPFVWELIHINSVAASMVGQHGRGIFLDGMGQNLPECPRKMEAFFESVVRTGKPQALGRLCYERFELGEKHFMARAIPLDARTVAVTFEDISEYRRLRAELKSAEARLREVADAGIITWRANPHNWKFSFISPMAQTVLGYWPERWIGERAFFLKRLHPEDREMVNLACIKAFEERRQLEFDCRFLTVDGGVRHFRTSVFPARISFEKYELSGMMIDITAIKDAEAKAHELSAQILQAQDDERRRISRELHDSVGQYLSAAKMTLKILERNDPDSWQNRARYLNQCDELIEQAVREVRTVSYLLHPPLLDEVGLASALKWAAEGLADRSGMRVEVHVPDSMTRLEGRVEMALFRIAQEALLNVHRHSHSDYAAVRLQLYDSKISLEIEDRGRGLPAEVAELVRRGDETAGVGLRGMRERANELKGNLEVLETKRGTLIRAVVPRGILPAEPENGPSARRRSSKGKESSNGAPKARAAQA